MSKAIQCHIRLRPSVPSDGPVNPGAIRMEENKLTALNASGDKRYRFDDHRFDQCHDASSSQEDVFSQIEPLLQQAYNGINTTIFAYGVTGSGKTYTMQGDCTKPGLIPRTVAAVFAKRNELGSSCLSVAVSYVEILKDEVYDLLSDQLARRKSDIRQSSNGQTIVADLTTTPLDSMQQFNRIYQNASKARKTAVTKLNSSSSRSHAILTIHLEIADGTDPTAIRTSKICLTDLAGSENNNLTGNDKERMRESSAINTSLTTLGKVIDALNAESRRPSTGHSFIPYRESKLTRLLQDALGGSSQGLLICCLAPGEKFARDTLHTLQFSKKSKAVDNCPIINKKTAHPRRLSAPPSSLVQSRALSGAKTFKVHASATSAPSANASINAVKGLERVPLGEIPSNVDSARPAVVRVKHDLTLLSNKENKAISQQHLNDRIQKIVGQESSQLKRQPNGLHRAAPEAKQTVNDVIHRLTREERDARARVLTTHARKLQQSGDFAKALDLYRKASEHVPGNERLRLRVAELELSLEGILQPSSPSSQGGPPEKSGLKRSHGHLDSLAELSDSPAKVRRTGAV
ncbi:hypothetical protein IAU60_002251 [Kwoniella sp. DSM 27419]